MKDSEVLKKARKKIAKGTECFICWAIDSTKGATDGQKDALKDWVDLMLGDNMTYEGWIRENKSVPHDTHTKMKLKENAFRDGRIQWLDWMIDYCEKEEANVTT